MGLDGLLRARSRSVAGILNGIDEHLWDPSTDTLIAEPFDVGALARRPANKAALNANWALTSTRERSFSAS
jgi:starch synthase